MEQLNFFEKLEEPNKPICPVCGNDFEKYKNKKFCSKKCSNKEWCEANKDRLKLQNKEWYETNKDRIRLQNREWYKTNKGERKDKRKKYSEVNKDKIRLRMKEWHKANKDKKECYNKEYNKVNKDKLRLQKKEYNKVNKDKIRLRNIEYVRKKYKADNNFRLKSILRHRIRNAIKGTIKGTKSDKTINLIGCSIIEVKNHLEKQFKKGMTWENHGRYGWHIDHIMPCSSFDLTDPDQQKKCFHYTNLQPLWAHENLSKGSKIPLDKEME